MPSRRLQLGSGKVYSRFVLFFSSLRLKKNLAYLLHSSGLWSWSHSSASARKSPLGRSTRQGRPSSSDTWPGSGWVAGWTRGWWWWFSAVQLVKLSKKAKVLLLLIAFFQGTQRHDYPLHPWPAHLPLLCESCGEDAEGGQLPEGQQVGHARVLHLEYY